MVTHKTVQLSDGSGSAVRRPVRRVIRDEAKNEQHGKGKNHYRPDLMTES
jgi:hypothetical protein